MNRKLVATARSEHNASFGRTSHRAQAAHSMHARQDQTGASMLGHAMYFRPSYSMMSWAIAMLRHARAGLLASNAAENRQVVSSWPAWARGFFSPSVVSTAPEVKRAAGRRTAFTPRMTAFYVRLGPKAITLRLPAGAGDPAHVSECSQFISRLAWWPLPLWARRRTLGRHVCPRGKEKGTSCS